MIRYVTALVLSGCGAPDMAADVQVANHWAASSFVVSTPSTVLAFDVPAHSEKVFQDAIDGAGAVDVTALVNGTSVAESSVTGAWGNTLLVDFDFLMPPYEYVLSVAWGADK